MQAVDATFDIHAYTYVCVNLVNWLVLLWLLLFQFILIRDVTWYGITSCLHFDWYGCIHTFSPGKNLFPKIIKSHRSSTLARLCTRSCVHKRACVRACKRLSNWLNGSFLSSFTFLLVIWNVHVGIVWAKKCNETYILLLIHYIILQLNHFEFENIIH